MRKVFCGLAAIVLAVGLPSAAFANETVEISAGAEGAEGDKLDIVVAGDTCTSLEGAVKLDCKDEGDQIIKIKSSIWRVVT